MTSADPRNTSRHQLIDATIRVVRGKGYVAARVEDICERAGLTKGSFFHHFKSKEDVALAAAERFAERADERFASAAFATATDPRERVLGYVDFRIAMLEGALPDYTCLLGTIVQETYDTHPALRAACERPIGAHAAAIGAHISQAKQRYAPDATFDAEGLAYFVQAVIQGSFVLAKAKGGPEIAAECLRHLRSYLELLLTPRGETTCES